MSDSADSFPRRIGSAPIPKQKDDPLLGSRDSSGLPRFKSHAPTGFKSNAGGGVTDRLQSIAESGPTGQQRLRTFQTVKAVLEEGTKLPASQPTRGLGGRLVANIKRRLSLVVETPDVDKEKDELIKVLRQKRGKTGDQDSLIHLKTFRTTLDVKGEKFAAQLFSALDEDNRGYVTDEQLVSTMLNLKRGTPAEKIAFIWSFVTTNPEEITRSQLAELIRAGWSEKDSSVSLDPMAVDDLTEAFFRRAGRAHEATLSLQDFTMVLESRPELKESLLLGDLKASRQEGMEKKFAFSFLPLWERVTALDDFTFPFWMTLIVLAQLAAFAAGMVQWSHKTGPKMTTAFLYDGWTYPIAKGAGRALQVTVILFPFTVARGFLTFLRTTPLANILPLDGHIEFHKHLAYQFGFWGTLHTICHIINAVRQSEMSRYMTLKSFTGVSQAEYWSYEVQVTGVLLCFFLLLGYIPALLKGYASGLEDRDKKRHAKRFPLISKLWLSFEVFYVTHIIMACTVLILLIIHPYPGNLKDFGTGPNVPKPTAGTPQEGSTWIYLLAGTVVYLLERIARWFKGVLWDTDVLEVILHPGRVTELKLRKPGRLYNSYQAFNGKPGQYCFIKIPALAAFEWHPFSLTSASHDDFISFHIRVAGDWTGELYQMCEKLCNEHPGDANSLDMPPEMHETMTRRLIRPPFEVQVDGPCGAPAQDYSGFEVVLLAGLGIGVTPFAAVLRQLVEEFNQSKCEKCGTCNHTLFKTKRVYFYWVDSEREAPKYFQQFLSEIVKIMPDFLEVNIHFTKALAENDVRITIGRIAQLIQHEDDNFDAVSGVHQLTPVYLGRPKWPKIFDRIRQENPGTKVGVFVCGKRIFSSELKGICIKQNKEALLKEKTNPTQFIFHKENF